MEYYVGKKLKTPFLKVLFIKQNRNNLLSEVLSVCPNALKAKNICEEILAEAVNRYELETVPVEYMDILKQDIIKMTNYEIDISNEKSSLKNDIPNNAFDTYQNDFVILDDEDIEVLSQEKINSVLDNDEELFVLQSESVINNNENIHKDKKTSVKNKTKKRKSVSPAHVSSLERTKIHPFGTAKEGLLLQDTPFSQLNTPYLTEVSLKEHKGTDEQVTKKEDIIETVVWAFKRKNEDEKYSISITLINIFLVILCLMSLVYFVMNNNL